MAAIDLSHMVNNPRAKALRKHCVDFMRVRVKGKRLAVPLSGGVDSHVCLFSALEIGLTPTVYSFTLKDRESRDFRTARATAEYFGLDFVPVYLDTDVEEIREHVWNICHKIIPEYQLSKTTIECTWPMARLFDVLEEPQYTMGFGGDTPYAMALKQKKMYLAGHYVDMLKQYYDSNGRHQQLLFHMRYLELLKKKITYLIPMNHPAMFEIFKTFDPYSKEENPTNKAISRAAFWDYFSQVRVYGQQDYHKGDTGIADQFELLLDTDWQGSGKTVKAIYNRVLFNEASVPPRCVRKPLKVPTTFHAKFPVAPY